VTPVRGPQRNRADLDEDDVRIRPGRGKSRPRSKSRPSHSDGVTGMVVAVDRGRFTVSLQHQDPVYAVKARELGRKGVVVGDQVLLTGDLGGGADALARIVRVQERTTVLRRSADDSDPVERIIVANADQLAIVVALADPIPSPGLIDRALAAGFDAGLRALLVLTKSDLAAPDELLAMYQPLDVTTLVTGEVDSTLDPEDLDRVANALTGRVTVLLGHSGVGKSTLVNALIPGAGRLTGRVNEVTGRGRHTSSAAVALPLPSGGWIIDTPGVRSLGLAHIDPDRVLASFADLASVARASCPRGCTHTGTPADCALDGYVGSGAAGPGGPARLASLRRLLASLAA
jgi:ribosome biogenesis GTPase